LTVASLHQSKCFNHHDREAVARCPECRNYFCRECVTEHEGRLICASCLQKADVPVVGETRGFLGKSVGMLAGSFKLAVGLLLVWIVFYAIGQLLLLIPDSFHSGDIWRSV
jgi:hypothetical protein